MAVTPTAWGLLVPGWSQTGPADFPQGSESRPLDFGVVDEVDEYVICAVRGDEPETLGRC